MDTGSEKSSKTVPSHLNGFESDVIMLKVGPDEQILTAHKDVLVQVPFFKAILCRKEGEAQFQEATDGCISLPDDDAQTFANLLRYLYAGLPLQSPAPSPFIAPAKSIGELRSLVKVYILANKLGSEIVENHAMDAAAKYCQSKWADSLSIALLRNRGLSDTKLYRFLIEELAHDFGEVTKDKTNWTRFKSRFEEGMAIFSGQDCLRFLELHCGERKGSIPSQRHRNNPCEWHVHHCTDRCLPAGPA